MKRKHKAKHKNVLHYTLRYIICRRKQEQLHNKLLLAINDCPSKDELNTLLQFKPLLSEPMILHVYHRRMAELQSQAA